MPRIRTIKPEFWEDEKIASLKREVRLMFIGMLNFADDQGVIKANSTYIRSRIFPYDEDVRISDVNQWLGALVKARILIPFDFANEGYYMIRTFSSHQVIDKRYAKYAIAEDVVNALISNSHNNFNNHVGDTRGTHSEHVGSPPQDRIGKDRIGEDRIEEEGPHVNDSIKNCIKQPQEAPPKITYPWTSTEFLTLWANWKAYRKGEFKVDYKTVQSEQAALSHLSNLANGSEPLGVKIIMQSMQSTWKGLFPLKTEYGQQSSGSLKDKLSERLREKFGS